MIFKNMFTSKNEELPQEWVVLDVLSKEHPELLNLRISIDSSNNLRLSPY